MNTETLNHAERVLVWTFGSLRQMRIWGLVGGGDAHPLTPKGVSLWDQLDMDWKPSDSDLKSCIESHVCRNGSKDLRAKMLFILRDFRDNRETMNEFVEHQQRKDF